MGIGVFLEHDKRLSESMLWQINRAYYERRGADSWLSGELPSYATCNTYIARAYAQIALAYVRDAVAAGLVDREQPLYIIELAAGLGRFAFQFLTAFGALHRASSVRDVTVTYVMTDFTASAIAAWRRHPQLAPFVATGALELAVLDIDRPTELQLRGGNPMVVVANYAFDTFRQDLYRVERGRLHESVVTLRSPEAVPDLTAVGVLRELRMGVAHREIAAGNTGDAALDRVLDYYAGRLPDATFSVPSIGVKALAHLAALAGGRLLLLASDKGVTQEAELPEMRPERIEQHADGFSMDVNFDALGRWFGEHGGGCVASRRRTLMLKTVACWMGDATAFADTIEVARAVIEEFGPGEFFELLQRHRRYGEQLDLDAVLGLLRLSGFEPQVVVDFGNLLARLAAQADEHDQAELARALERSWESYFVGPRDVALDFARVYASMHRTADALRYAENSLAAYGLRPLTFVAIGAFRYQAGDRDAARAAFEHALTLDATCSGARAWIVRLDAER